MPLYLNLVPPRPSVPERVKPEHKVTYGRDVGRTPADNPVPPANVPTSQNALTPSENVDETTLAGLEHIEDAFKAACPARMPLEPEQMPSEEVSPPAPRTTSSLPQKAHSLRVAAPPVVMPAIRPVRSELTVSSVTEPQPVVPQQWGTQSSERRVNVSTAPPMHPRIHSADRSRRIEGQYDIDLQPPGLVQQFATRPPSVAIVVQYDAPRFHVLPPHPGRPAGYKPILSVSAAANFGLREPGEDATVVVLMPANTGRLKSMLSHFLALVFRGAACSPQRFSEEGMDVFLHATGSNDRNTGSRFGVWLGPNASQRRTVLRVSDLAGHNYKLPVTLHDLTAKLGCSGLQTMQKRTGFSPTVPPPVGDVGQDMAALLRTDPAEYRQVAAHQARLAMYYALSKQYDKSTLS